MMDRKTYSRLQEKVNDKEPIAESTLPSRAAYHGKKRKGKRSKEGREKKTKVSVPLILLLILLMLPIGIISIISTGGPSKANPASKSSGEEVSFETDDTLQEEPPSVNEENEPEEEPEEEPEIETIKQEEPKRQNTKKPAEDRKEEKKPVNEDKEGNEAQSEEEKEADEQSTEADGTVVYHTVKPGETLFRIAMNYYQSQDGIDKIRQANGLGSNEISVGQTLKIPKP